MATKVQQMQRVEGDRYRERRLPTVERLDPPREGGLPAVPVQWYPQQSRALEFSKALLGATSVAETLMKTEAGEQYKEAKARASRGDFTIDDSGFFTFRKEQQRAVSEVEGTLAADQAFNTLAAESEQWKQELAENQSLTPAQRVALYTEKVRQATFAQLNNGADADYTLAKGGLLHDKASALVNSYRAETLGAELQRERDMTGQVFHNTLRDMPAGLTEYEAAEYRMAALQKYQDNWSKVTGGIPFQNPETVARVKQLVTDLAVKGDFGTLEHMMESPLADGSTLGGMGLINEDVLERARENAITRDDIEFKKLERVQQGNLNIYGPRSADLDLQLAKLRDLSGTEREEQVMQIDQMARELLTEIDNLPSGALSANALISITKQIEQTRELAANGGTKQPMPQGQATLIRSLLEQGDPSAYPLLRENSRYTPPDDLKTAMGNALQYADAKSRTDEEQALWVAETMNAVEHPAFVEGPMFQQIPWKQSADYEKARLALGRAVLNVQRENPKLPLEDVRIEAEKRFFSTYRRIGEEEKQQLGTVAAAFAEVENASASSNPEQVVFALGQFPKLSEANRRVMLSALERNESLDAEQKSTLRALAQTYQGDEKAMAMATREVVTTREALEALGSANPNQPVKYFGEHGNNLFKPLITLGNHRILVRETGEDGKAKLVEKNPATELSSLDAPVTGIYPEGAQILENGKAVPITQLKDLSLLDAPGVPISEDPKVPIYNPLGYPDDVLPKAPLANKAHPAFSANLSNRNKPLEDHVVVLGTRFSGLVGREVKRLGDCSEEEKSRIMSRPFDPDRKLLIAGFGAKQAMSVREIAGYSLFPYTVLSNKPLDCLSAKEQIAILNQ